MARGRDVKNVLVDFSVKLFVYLLRNRSFCYALNIVFSALFYLNMLVSLTRFSNLNSILCTISRWVMVHKVLDAHMYSVEYARRNADDVC